MCQLKFECSHFEILFNPFIVVDHGKGPIMYSHGFIVDWLAIENVIKDVMETFIRFDGHINVFEETFFYHVSTNCCILYDMDLNFN